MSPRDLENLPEGTSDEWPVSPPPLEDVLTGEDVVVEEDGFYEDSGFTTEGTQDPATLAAPAPAVFEDEIPLEEALETAETTVVVESVEELPLAATPLDADFVATEVNDAAPWTQDVLQHRGDVPDATVELTQEPLQDTTGVLRRSLVTSPVEPTPTIPLEPYVAPETEALSPADRNLDATLMAGATILPSVTSRAGSRWLSVIGILLLTPVLWYLLSDSAARLILAEGNPWETGVVNPAALGELVGGLAVLALVAILAAQSSLGLLISGTILTIAGLPFLVVPGATSDMVSTYLQGPLENLGGFGQNVLFHLSYTGATGILFMSGVAMLISAWAAYRLRRKGRREEALRAEVAAVNPGGLRARWARKATERSYN